MNIYLIITAGGLLGIFGHALQVINKINKRHPHTDFKSLFREYWATEWLSLISSVALFGIILFVAADFLNLQKVEAPDPDATKEVKALYWKLSVFIRCASVVAGWFADSIVYGFMGVMEKRIQKKIQEQTPAV